MSEYDRPISIAVGGGTPGADSNDYILFASDTALGAGKRLGLTGWQRIEFGGNNSQAGTLKAYFSTDGGLTYTQYYSLAVPAAAGTAMTGPVDFDVAPYDDWKLVWGNGGVAQGTWKVHMHAFTNRNPAT